MLRGVLLSGSQCSMCFVRCCCVMLCGDLLRIVDVNSDVVALSVVSCEVVAW